jgi:phosphotriesterase-related protein
MPHLVTTLGPKTADDLGMILPHEHVFVDLRTWDQPGYATADAADVVALMAPQIAAIKARGVTALVECSTGGVGLRADFDLDVSAATGFPIVVPTGFYREPWIPPWVHEASESDLADHMRRALQGTIGDTGVQAGWIKISAGDDGITDCEAKVLRAACAAAKDTGAVIGSHTIKGRVVRRQLDILEAAGGDPGRFIWIHTHAEPDFTLHKEMARRGCWIEYDAIGSDWLDDATALKLIQKVLDAGLIDRLLISQDRGWYDPAQPGGGTPKPYTYITDTFIPRMKAAGIDDAAIHRLTHVNPFRAFAR